jgi:hypothetical protein
MIPTEEQHQALVAIPRELQELGEAGRLDFDAWVRLVAKAEEVAPGHNAESFLNFYNPAWEPERLARLAAVQAKTALGHLPTHKLAQGEPHYLGLATQPRALLRLVEVVLQLLVAPDAALERRPICLAHRPMLAHWRQDGDAVASQWRQCRQTKGE